MWVIPQFSKLKTSTHHSDRAINLDSAEALVVERYSGSDMNGHWEISARFATNMRSPLVLIAQTEPPGVGEAKAQAVVNKITDAIANGVKLLDLRTV